VQLDGSWADSRFWPRALYGAYAKLAWGIKHIEAFQKERDRLLGQLDRPAIVFDQKLDPQAKDWVVTVAEVAEFPSLSLPVGDAAHNLRSALDYLVWEMAYIDGGGVDPPHGKTQFPIMRRPTDFTSRTTYMLENVSNPHRAIIERFQPYKRWKGLDFHPLGLLRDINDDDKHRLVVTTPVTAAGFEGRFPHWGGNCHVEGKISGRAVIRHPLDVGTEVLRIGLVITGPNPKMKVDTDVPIEVSLVNGLPVDYALAEIARAVDVVLKRFLSFFNNRSSRAIWRQRPGRLQPRSLGGQNIRLTKHTPPS
jgi:hypothetical protein